MARILNRITSESAAKLNAKLDDTVDSNSPVREKDADAAEVKDYWDFMRNGLSAITSSDTRHLMFPEE